MGRIGVQRRRRSFLYPSVVTAALTLSSQRGLCNAISGLESQHAAFLLPSNVPSLTPSNCRKAHPTYWNNLKTFSTAKIEMAGDNVIRSSEEDEKWNDVLPFEKGSHNSARIKVPSKSSKDGGHSFDGLFDQSTFRTRLRNTIKALEELKKSSVWVEVPMSRASLIEEMEGLGFEFHHANGRTAKLTLWLKDTESKIPEFATHHVGVGALVINSKEEILCVRELRRNFLPWKIPGGLSDLGEHLSEAAEREVMEETGIRTKFHSVLSFRHTHGMANGRSDMYFVCRLDPIEETGEDGNVVIPVPIPQESEIERAEWIPLSEYKDMVHGVDGETGHPMMSHVMDIYDQGLRISQRTVHSVVPGRAPNPIYHPDSN